MTPRTVDQAYRFGRYTLEPREQRLWRNGEPVHLSGKAHELLAILVARAGQLVTREELLATMWPDSTVEDSNITVHIGALRRALDDIADPIETVPRLGYRFTARVTTTETRTGPPTHAPSSPGPTPVQRAARTRRLLLAVAGVAVSLAAWLVLRSPLESFRVTVTPEENLDVAWCCNAAVALEDGRVLIGGGASHSQNARDRADPWIYEPRFWLVTQELRDSTGRLEPQYRRDGPTATRLADGRVLFAGGYGCVNDTPEACRVISRERVPLTSAVIFDPYSNTVTAVTGGMHRPHAGHTATLLGDGTVLIVGGYHGPPASDDWGTAVELFDPAAPEGSQFRLLEPLSPAVLQGLTCDTCAGDVRKADHTATLLSDGSVLIAGGWRGAAAAGRFDGSLRYRPGDPGLTLASPTGRPFLRAASATATLLADGRVLFAGGTRDFSMAGSLEYVLAATTIYDPVTDAQTHGPSLSVPRVGHSATAISPHSVVFIGGMRCDLSAEQVRARGPHDPERPRCDAHASGDIVTIEGAGSSVSTFPMVGGTAYHAAAMLPDGRIYIPGGLVRSGTPSISTLTVSLTRR